MKLQGNIYELHNKWYLGYLWNLLPDPATGNDLCGHYTVIFSSENNFEVFQHGGYASTGVLTNYEKKYFKGFLSLKDSEKEFIKGCLRETIPVMQKYPYAEGRKLCGTIKVFDWDYERGNPPHQQNEN